jgi:hypothetical protein
MPTKKTSTKKPPRNKAPKKKQQGTKPKKKKQRGLPATVWTITIQAGGTVPSGSQNLQISPSDTIKFKNGASFPVNIHYTVPPLADTNNLAMGATSGATGGSSSNQLNVTVNYYVVNSNNTSQKSGPYSVQFGNGPLLITIDSSDTEPDPVTIAKGAKIQFFCVDNNYSINWTPSNIWSPEPTTLVRGMNIPAQTALAGAAGKSVTYTIAPSNRDTRGGGTVGVGS